MANFCSNCGTKVDPSWNACPKCGSPLGGRASSLPTTQGYPQPVQRPFGTQYNGNSHKFSTLSLIFGVIGSFLSMILPVIGIILGVLAIIFCLIGITRDQDKVMATIGLILGIIAIVVGVIVIMLIIFYLS